MRSFGYIVVIFSILATLFFILRVLNLDKMTHNAQIETISSLVFAVGGIVVGVFMIVKNPVAEYDDDDDDDDD